jgi:hypothetical protein
MYEVGPGTARVKPSLGLFMLLFAGAYTATLCVVYGISLYVSYSSDAFMPRIAFIVVMPMVSSMAFYLATALYRMLTGIPAVPHADRHTCSFGPRPADLAVCAGAALSALGPERALHARFRPALPRATGFLRHDLARAGHTAVRWYWHAAFCRACQAHSGFRRSLSAQIRMSCRVRRRFSARGSNRLWREDLARSPWRFCGM